MNTRRNKKVIVAYRRRQRILAIKSYIGLVGYCAFVAIAFTLTYIIAVILMA